MCLCEIFAAAACKHGAAHDGILPAELLQLGGAILGRVAGGNELLELGDARVGAVEILVLVLVVSVGVVVLFLLRVVFLAKPALVRLCGRVRASC